MDKDLKFFGGMTIFGLIGLLVLFQDVQNLTDMQLTGEFVTGIHMGAPSKNVKLSRQLIDGKEVMKAIIVPDKPFTKQQCKSPMCWYEDRYTDAQGVHVTGKRDFKGININRCHSDNALVEARVREKESCFVQKIYCKQDGTWATWQAQKKC